jgi:transcriptional regulator GlxA family with amidase domain
MRRFALLLVLSACASAPRPPAVELKPGAKNVAIVALDTVFNTELVAPMDVFQHTGEHMNVFIVGRTTAPVRTYEGLTILPHFGFEDAPKIDVLVVPSTDKSLTSELEDEAYLAFLRERGKSAELVTSHCWGAFPIAAAGLLDDREATTYPPSIPDLAQRFPKVKVISDRRFVRSENRITSSGGLASFEAALFVVSELYGRELAERIAKGLVFGQENRSSALER